MIQLDFKNEEWFSDLCSLIKSKYDLNEDHAKLLTCMLTLGKKLTVNQIQEVMDCDHSRADALAEALKDKSLVTLITSRPHKVYESRPYEEIWPEVKNSFDFINICKTTIEQYQETIHFDEEVIDEDMEPFEKQHDVVNYMINLHKQGHSFIVLKEENKDSSKILLWKIIEERLKKLKYKNIKYQSSKLNAIIIIKDKPIGLIRLKKIIKKSGAPELKGIRILDEQFANIIHKSEVK